MVENEERRNKSDSDFVETLIDELKVKVEVKYITRLGSSKVAKCVRLNSYVQTKKKRNR